MLDRYIDNFKTKDELLLLRALLLLKLMQDHPNKSWMSPCDWDSTKIEGYFIAGINTSSLPISFHIPLVLWDLARQTHAPVLPKAPFVDKTSAAEQMRRIARWISSQHINSKSKDYTDYVNTLYNSPNYNL